jgi:hypothetical protein
MRRIDIAIAESLENGGRPALLETDCSEIHADWVRALVGEADTQDFSTRSGTWRFSGPGWDVRVLPVVKQAAQHPLTRRTLAIQVERLQRDFDETVAALRQGWSLDGMTALVVALENLRMALSDMEAA